jgi:hypothetical protein
VLGVHAVGDAHTCTNPLYGRGCSLAMVQADLLADAVTAEPTDHDARARAYEAASAREIEPWYRASVAQDRAARQRIALEQAARDGADEPATVDHGDPDVPSQPDMAAELLRDGLLPAVGIDAVVFRAFLRGFNLLEPPEALMADPEVVSRVLAVFQDRDNRPPPEPLGPPRAEMLSRLDRVAG